MRVGEDRLGWILSFISAVVYNLGKGRQRSFNAICSVLSLICGLPYGQLKGRQQISAFPGRAALLRISGPLSARALVALRRRGRWHQAEMRTSALLKQVTAKSPVQGATEGPQATDFTAVTTESILHEGPCHTMLK